MMKKLNRNAWGWLTALLGSAMLTACGGGGGGAATATAPPPSGPPVAVLAVDCSGVNCGAASETAYSGTGTGVWRFANAANTDAYIDIDITGVSGGQNVTLAFTNGNDTSVTTLPQSGTPASVEPVKHSTATSEATPASHSEHMAAHSRMLQQNVLQRQRLAHGGNAMEALGVGYDLTPRKPSFTPAVNATRTWTDYDVTPAVAYATTAKAVCSLPNGRNVVFWQDNADTYLTAGNLATFQNAVCGANKGFDKLFGLLGDAWGTHSFPSTLISDSPTKQDINIVFLMPSASTGWAGYFYSLNNFKSTLADPSNEALAFFINTRGVPSDVNWYVSTLLHEAKHMVSYYQNDVVRSKTTDTWFEETGAIMAEDIIVWDLIGYNKVQDYRLPSYMGSGGNISLNNWPTLSDNHYGMGGALGAFLNRRYGTRLLSDSITQCTSGAAKTNSYACVDGLIKSYAYGLGLADEEARMGASLYAKLPSTGIPSGFGYPQVTSNGFTLIGINTSVNTLASPSALGANYGSMVQTYVNDTVASGVTRYRRLGVVVPALTTLRVVIR